MKRENRVDWGRVLARAIAVLVLDRRYSATEAAGLLGLSKRALFYHHTIGHLGGKRENTGRASQLMFLGRAIIRWCREQSRHQPRPMAA